MIINCFVETINQCSTDYNTFWIYSENDTGKNYKTFYLAFYYTYMCNTMTDMHIIIP